jgi:hypothetical protein
MGGKLDTNPMHRAQTAARCRAHSKQTGLPCMAPAVRGWRVCRMHGARGGAPRGKAHGQYRHGARTIEANDAKRLVSALARLARELET